MPGNSSPRLDQAAAIAISQRGLGVLSLGVPPSGGPVAFSRSPRKRGTPNNATNSTKGCRFAPVNFNARNSTCQLDSSGVTSLAMKLISVIFTAIFLCFAETSPAQSFMNLNFESASVSGYSPGSFAVPISSALPGWSGYYSNTWSGYPSNTTFGATFEPTDALYDSATLGVAIGVVDTNFSPPPESPDLHMYPLQGNYSAVLFGGEAGGGPTFYSSTISQTGLVPAGTASLLFDAKYWDSQSVVTLGGATVSVTPLHTFPNYTLYGATIPTEMAGQIETLSFTELSDLLTSGMLELDNIQFSSIAIPEPGTLALAALGALLFGFRRRQS
jgi:hypothetical protein